MPRIILTTGSYDLLHIGHVRRLRQVKELGDILIVGLATDEFMLEKGKQFVYPYEHRKEILESIRYVDIIVPEKTWETKGEIVKEYNVDVYAIGDDWLGTCDWLKPFCTVIYLPRTPEISTTQIKEMLKSK